MDAPAAPDDALVHPTRARVFAALGELRRPAGTDELAVSLGLHPNGVRLHLDRLLDASLVTRERVRQARGRPRDMWSVAAGARPGGQAPTAYLDLGRWLARVISSGKTSLRKVEEAGREIGQGLAPARGDTSAQESMQASLASMGFAPTRAMDADGETLTITLGNCPFRQAASENIDVVCTLHRGITQGLLDEIAPTTKLTGFIPRDPHTAGCLIHLRGDLAEDESSQATTT